ncbi:MAG: hydantoinase/oxoprolinase family protein, partial [Proteobacteria bacterium]|nr:hydantoinase/oxoprolinase family protein [Pseudomonadota bacterium]
PPSPGLFSSFGLLYADVEHHYSRTFRHLLRKIDLGELNRIWDRMVDGALDQLAVDGFSEGKRQVRRTASMHYQGQTFELTVPVPDGPIDEKAVAVLEESFSREHERTYGHRAGADEPLELVNMQVVGYGVSERSRVPDRILATKAGEAAPLPPRQVYFGPEAGWQETPILRRSDLETPRQGPCIVEEYDATVVIPPDSKAELDTYGNILIDLL